MFIEEYHKSKGGRPFYSVYYRFGQVEVSVANIKAESKEEAKEKAMKYLKKALEGEG